MKIPVILVVLIFGPPQLLEISSAAPVSELWGEKGEKYDPAGLLPDFSFAGYERGEKAIPERLAEVSVKSFGAVGDGKTDDTAAFQRAVKEAAGKVIGIPAGKYLISDVIEIVAGGTVIKGAGAGKTTLVFTKGLQTLRPMAAVTGGNQETTAWSWGGGLVWFKGNNPIGAVLAAVALPGAKRGDTEVPVADAAKLSVGQEIAIEVKDDSSGSFVSYIFRASAMDADKLNGKLAYRQVARIREIRGSKVLFDRPLRFDLRPEWNATLRAFTPGLQQAGIEDLSFDFPKQAYRGHFEEDGFNALQFDHCVNSWARRLVINNSDSGIFLRGYFCTVSDVLFTADRRPEISGRTGHHGLDAGGADNLLTRFQFKTRFFHELTVANATGNVFSAGEGELLTLDHHKGAPYENLFTDLDTGVGGPEIWKSGGPPGVGSHTAAGATFWNIRGRNDPGLPPKGWGPPGLVFVGLKGTVRNSEQRDGWHYESMSPGALEPVNIHLAQLQRRLATQLQAVSIFREWTTTKGQTFKAKLVGLSGSTVTFVIEDGRQVPYPLAGLTPQSRKQVTELSGAAP